MQYLRKLSSLALPIAAGATIFACSSTPKGGGFGDNGTPVADAGEPGPIEVPPALDFDASPGDSSAPTSEARDPETCAEALTTKSYVGCDYWPTITPNAVWSTFDYAVIVANAGKVEADVQVTGANNVKKTVKVGPGELQKVYLPWVPALKGADADECGSSPTLSASALVSNGAYHLVSSVPVIVYQFNALQYKPIGGEPGKSWATCPGSITKCDPKNGSTPALVGCFSYSNDASLLLPSSAMTKTYRVTGMRGDTAKGLVPILQPDVDISPSYMAITATQDATDLSISLSSSANVVAGGAIIAGKGGSLLRVTLAKAGDVALIVTKIGFAQDVSGSIVSATKPVQVISGAACSNIPDARTPACDHVEETVLPAETLGRRYLITAPSKPAGGIGKHVLRFYGNVNGTSLSYVPAAPAGCPTTLNAGQVVECGVVETDIQVTGSKEFAVSGFQVSAQAYGLLDRRGDPSQTSFPSVEQFRRRYVFLAPDDYDVNYADIACESATKIVLDGAAVTAPFVAIGNSGYGVRRVKLGLGKGGAHVLEADRSVGVQVLGYGDNTSYQYPAGLNLNLIAPPPTVN
jgi:IgGFc binding protein